MLKNYLKIAYRNLLKNKLYALINIFGLAVAMAYSIVAYLNHSYNYTFDTFHRRIDKIYRVETVERVDGQEQVWGTVPRPLGPALARDFAAIERAVRLNSVRVVFRHGEKFFNETVLHVDSTFFSMFDFPLKYGSPQALRETDRIILSDELALKYFGDVNPIGRQLSLRYGGSHWRDVVVGGVAAKIPDNSSIQFDALASLQALVDAGLDRPDDWAAWTHVTFVQVGDATQLPTVAAALEPYIAAHNAAAEKWQIARFTFVPLRGLARRAWQANLGGDILKRAMHPAGMISPTIIAVLLILMACFNYINTSIAFSSKRLKEIGLRKVLGGSRAHLIAQFMIDNFLLCLLAFVAALGLAEIFVPAHDSLWTYFELSLDYSQNTGLLLFLGGLLALIALLAGAYPAVYISGYHPVQIFRGRLKFGGKSWLSRFLLTFQFAVSILTVLGSLVFIRNADFLREMDLGYDKTLLAVVPLADSKDYEPYRQAIADHAGILRVAGSRHHVNQTWMTRTLESAAAHTQASVLDVGYNYLETMRLRLLAGRDFKRRFSADAGRSVIVNQKLVQAFGWANPLGQTVSLDSVRYTVVGVVEDFFNGGVWRPVQPCVFRLVQPQDFRYLVARIRPGKLAEANTFLRTAWQHTVPETPYEGYYQDEVLTEAISVSESIKTMFIYISALALAIAGMGLFALVSLNIARRTKEIGIRKVLGATILNILHLVNREFVLLLAAAFVFASVVGYFSVQALLRSIYAYHAGLSAGPFLLSGLIMFTIAAATVGSHVLRASLANPVESLRYE